MIKCEYFNDATNQCTSPYFDGCNENKDCIQNIEIKQGDILEIECGECEGFGEMPCPNQGWAEQNLDPQFYECPTCQGMGSFKLEVLEKVDFKICGNGMISNNIQEIRKIRKITGGYSEMEDGKYWLLTGELVK